MQTVQGEGAFAAEFPPVLVDTIPVAQVRPWIRYWARMLDSVLAALIAGLTALSFFPDYFSEPGGADVYGLIGLFGWVFVEALLLATTGTTPGKWLLKTRLIPPDDEPFTYSTALARSFKVWWRGLGIGFPIVTFVTAIVAYDKLKANGRTSWDKEGGFTVVHERIGIVRAVIAVALIVVPLVLLFAATAAEG